jgi:hypothetical protein
MTRPRLLALGTTATALAAYAVVFARRDSFDDVASSLQSAFEDSRGSDELDLTGFNAFDPFRIGNAYLWLGVALALTVVVIAVVLLNRRPPRRRWMGPGSLVIAAAGALAVALANRSDLESTLPEIEGAYFTGEGPGSIVVSSTPGGSVFDPSLGATPISG